LFDLQILSFSQLVQRSYPIPASKFSWVGLHNQIRQGDASIPILGAKRSIPSFRFLFATNSTASAATQERIGVFFQARRCMQLSLRMVPASSIACGLLFVTSMALTAMPAPDIERAWLTRS
jgi:hypothetical protein